jgi:hypothetical protein
VKGLTVGALKFNGNTVLPLELSAQTFPAQMNIASLALI